jgi:hypothetical protein
MIVVMGTRTGVVIDPSLALNGHHLRWRTFYHDELLRCIAAVAFSRSLKKMNGQNVFERVYASSIKNQPEPMHIVFLS